MQQPQPGVTGQHLEHAFQTRRLGLADQLAPGQLRPAGAHAAVVIPAVMNATITRSCVIGKEDSSETRSPRQATPADSRAVLRAATRIQADTLSADTTALGYDTQWVCLRAADTGACHRRDRIFILGCQPAARARLAAAAHPGRRGFNDGESVDSWIARRDRQKKLGRNGNGIGTPLTIAIRLLPTPMASDSAAERAPQLGGQRPSGAKRQVGLPEVIVHHLARLHHGNVRASQRPGGNGCCPPPTPAPPRTATAGTAAGPATATKAARTWTRRPGPSPPPAAARSWPPGGVRAGDPPVGTVLGQPAPPRPSPVPAAGPGWPPRSPSG